MKSSRRKSSLLDDSEMEMRPLYVFLNSSLNVELVYIILKSITKFGLMQGESLAVSGKADSADIKYDQWTGNATLDLRKIKIKDYAEWSRPSSLSLSGDTMKTDGINSASIEING